MGVFDNWFTFKSPQQREYEERMYKLWAYPYGDKQKEILDNLIHEFIDEEDKQFSIYNYLVCRQALYPIDSDRVELSDEDYINAYKGIKKQLNDISKKLIHKYLAIIEADLNIDEELNYPSIIDLENRSNEIKKLFDKR